MRAEWKERFAEIPWLRPNELSLGQTGEMGVGCGEMSQCVCVCVCVCSTASG